MDCRVCLWLVQSPDTKCTTLSNDWHKETLYYPSRHGRECHMHLVTGLRRMCLQTNSPHPDVHPICSRRRTPRPGVDQHRGQVLEADVRGARERFQLSVPECLRPGRHYQQEGAPSPRSKVLQYARDFERGGEHPGQPAGPVPAEGIRPEGGRIPGIQRHVPGTNMSSV